MTRDAPIRGLYAIADAGVLAPERLLQAVEQALLGGAQVVQYRDKSGDARRRAREAGALAALCRHHGVPLIVNDDPGLAAAAAADGVHLGRDDVGIAGAREQLGRDAIIGVSCYDSLERALAAQRAGADYVAFGSFFPSPTKPAAVPAPVALLAAAKAALALPVVAIGGITPENAPVLIAAGADAVAVITGVFRQPDIREAASRYAALFAARATAPR